MSSPFRTVPAYQVSDISVGAAVAERARRDSDARDAVRAVLWRAKRGFLSVDEARDALSALGLLPVAAEMAARPKRRRRR